jgi:hypothetical protein
MNVNFNNLQQRRQNFIQHSNAMYDKGRPTIEIKKEAETKEDFGKVGMSL